MPELPEVEITARRLGASLAGAQVESALAPGMVALKSIDPPLAVLAGGAISGVRRIGKMPVVDFDPAEGALGAGDRSAEPLSMLVHLMSAGRLQLFDKRASLRDRTARVLVRLADGRELRLREFGTKQRAWAKLLRAAELDGEEMVATLGPEAWPAPPLDVLAQRIDQPRHLHPMLRDQRESRASAARGSTRSSGRPYCRRSSRDRSSTARTWTACMPPSTSSATRSIATSR